MHEAFLKKGDLPKDRQLELNALLTCRENCVVVHQACHERRGQTRQAEMDLAAYKVSRGYQLESYLMRVAQLIPSWSSPVWDRTAGRLILSGTK